MPESTTRGVPAPASYIPRCSPWLLWHAHWIRPGVRVLDLACGDGRHALTAARRGAEVVAIDRDAAKLEVGKETAAQLGLSIDWRCVDLEGEWPELGTFGVVLVFNYLDRSRMKDIVSLVGPQGLLIMETYLVWQRAMGWGPTSDAHLLQPGELATLVAPLEIVHGREVWEPLDAGRQRAMASVVAQRREM